MATRVDEFCNLCEVSFTSAKQANDHYEGRTHKNALIGESKLYCDLCKINCSCLESMNDHLEGKSHKRKEQEAMLSSVVDDENVIKDESGDGFCCKLCDIKCSGKENIKVHLQGKSHKKNMKKEMQVNIESSEEKSDGSLLYCEICQVSISGSDNMKIHVEGKAHKKKQLQQSNSHGDEKSKTNNDGNVEGNNGENDDSIYYDAQQSFDLEHITAENDLSGQSDEKDEPNIRRDRSSSSDEDNVGLQELDQTFVKNILESFEGGKYSKSIDHKDNLSLPLNKAVNHDFKSLNSSINYSNENKIEGKIMKMLIQHFKR